jgi:hypothetical protein
MGFGRDRLRLARALGRRARVCDGMRARRPLVPGLRTRASRSCSRSPTSPDDAGRWGSVALSHASRIGGRAVASRLQRVAEFAGAPGNFLRPARREDGARESRRSGVGARARWPRRVSDRSVASGPCVFAPAAGATADRPSHLIARSDVGSFPVGEKRTPGVFFLCPFSPHVHSLASSAVVSGCVVVQGRSPS